MREVRFLRLSDINSLLQRILSSYHLAAMPRLDIQKLRLCFFNFDLQSCFLHLISKKIADQPQVVIRLKSWVLLHLFLESKVEMEGSEEISDLI